MIDVHSLASRNDVVDDLKRVHGELHAGDPFKSVTRDQYRSNGEFSDQVWAHYFGTFTEFTVGAGLKASRQADKLQRDASRHAGVDHYRSFNKEKRDYSDKYLRENKTRYKTILGFADIHDIAVDPFYLRVLIDTAKRVQPDIICCGGDMFDLAEFSRFTIDPREWDIVGRIKFVHDNVLRPLREACPNAQFDFVEGNHEYRLVKHLADSSPGTRAILADLHGWGIAELLGLDQFEINYISEADLGTWTKRDEKAELSKNHKIYYDSFLVHHEPMGKNMGIPGWSGHHHRHAMWSFYSTTYGPYEWHQIGSGHRRSASYAEGLFWHNGFVISNVDTQRKTTNFDYIPVTDHAISGGKWYYREEEEVIMPAERK